MSSDFNYNFGFAVKEIFVPENTRKSRCFDTSKKFVLWTPVSMHPTESEILRFWYAVKHFFFFFCYTYQYIVEILSSK